MSGFSEFVTLSSSLFRFSLLSAIRSTEESFIKELSLGRQEEEKENSRMPKSLFETKPDFSAVITSSEKCLL
jgi:hypothetical protein